MQNSTATQPSGHNTQMGEMNAKQQDDGFVLTYRRGHNMVAVLGGDKCLGWIPMAGLQAASMSVLVGKLVCEGEATVWPGTKLNDALELYFFRRQVQKMAMAVPQPASVVAAE